MFTFQQVIFTAKVGIRPISEITSGFFETATNYGAQVPAGALVYFSYAKTINDWEHNVLCFSYYKFVTEFDDTEPIYIVTPSSCADYFPEANVLMDQTWKTVMLTDLPSNVNVIRPLL